VKVAYPSSSRFMVVSPSSVAFLAGCSGRQPLGVRCVRENKMVELLRGMATSPASIGVAGKVAAFAARWRGEAEMGANGDGVGVVLVREEEATASWKKV